MNIARLARRYLSSSSNVSELGQLMPRSLDQIVKRNVFMEVEADDIRNIWDQYFSAKERELGKVMSANEWNKMNDTATKYPNFVFPVQSPVNEKEYYLLYSDYQKGDFAMTYLEDFRKDPINAQPFFYLQSLRDLEEDKGLVFLYVQYLPYLSKVQAEKVFQQTLNFYEENNFESQLEAFNKDSGTFSMEKSFPFLF
eukprot:maker-scaffold_3-snap-gene-12.10-mRNA-1 protein AED:0.02 eAED:0.02 QI:10/1/1/1/0.66/0.5/4/349/196